MLKVTHFEGLDNLWKQLYLLVPYSALNHVPLQSQIFGLWLLHQE